MKSVVYVENGRFEVRDRPKPEIKGPRDAIVRVTTASICTSDLHIRAGAVPRAVPGIIVGHEFVGIVEEVGPEVRRVSPGDRVAVNVETFCGECFFCRRGWVNNCTDPAGGWALGCRIDGGQAEYVRIPYADNGLTPIPDGVSDEQALFTGDLLSTGYWAADIGDIEEGSVVAIIGAGPTGLCTAMCCRPHRPGTVVMIDTDRSRLDFALAHGLADVVVDPTEKDPEEVLRSLTEGRGADTIMEVAGGRGTFEMAWRIARPNATVVVVAMYEEPQVLPLPDMYGKNLVFKTGGVDASHCNELMDLISSGAIDPSVLITHRFPFDDVMSAYELFASRSDGVMKVALSMQGSSDEDRPKTWIVC